MIRIKIRKIVSINSSWLARLECGHLLAHGYGETERECHECMSKTTLIEEQLRGKVMVRVQSKMNRDVWDAITQRLRIANNRVPRFDIMERIIAGS